MSSGKIASQAGHAYLDSYLRNPDIDYLSNPTKVCLGVSDMELDRVCARCEQLGIDYVKVIDPDFTISDGNVIPNDGTQPFAFTAVGIGPITKREARKAVSNLKLL